MSIEGLNPSKPRQFLHCWWAH